MPVRWNPHLPTLPVASLRELDRRAEAEFGMPSLLLMENAGRGAADVLCEYTTSGRVAILCGRGNNGGDGLVLARHLDLRGFDVTIHCWHPPADWRGDAATNLRIIQASGLPLLQHETRSGAAACPEWHDYDWLVDALLGTGSVGPPRSGLAAVLASLPTNGRPRILSLDLPSGLDADRGTADGAVVRADVTCTFAAAKLGFTEPKAKAYLGDLWVADIGVPRRLLEQFVDAPAGGPPAGGR